MPEPTYSFSIPSIHDQTLLDCRVYHPKNLRSLSASAEASKTVKGAIVAHPYAPLGGSYDDAVVLSVTEALLDQGVIVGTFNFRGAAGSSGNTSLTGKAEQVDFESFIGFMITYLQQCMLPSKAVDNEPGDGDSYRSDPAPPQDSTIEMLLAGYSYGSLVLARLQPISAIVQHFREVAHSNMVSEIVSRANNLATETRNHVENLSDSSKGHDPKSNEIISPHNHRAPTRSVTIGDETPQSPNRKHSRDWKHNAESEHKDENAAQRRGSKFSRIFHHGREDSDRSSPTTPSVQQLAMTITARYLLISPVVLPFTQSLCPPGSPSSILSLGRSSTSPTDGSTFLDYPTLAVFGNKDVFTSSHRLRGWAEKESRETRSSFEWEEFENAGHFWREEGVMQALRRKMANWVERDD